MERSTATNIIVPERPVLGWARGHDAAMVDAQLAPRVVPTPQVGAAKLRPTGCGRRVALSLARVHNRHTTRQGQSCLRSTAARRFPADARDRKKGTIAALLVGSVTAPCRGVLGRQTVVLVAIGIAPSRSRAPELTSESDHPVGVWPGQSARLSSTHSPRLVRDPERLRSGPHGSGSLSPVGVLADRTRPRDHGGKQGFGFGCGRAYDWR